MSTERGFTLTEILIAVAIVGILSAAALVNHAVTVQRARFDAAREVLLQIYAGEQQFTQTQGNGLNFWPNPAATQLSCAPGAVACNNLWRAGIGMDGPLNNAPVTFSVTSVAPVAPAAGTFTATATFNGQTQTIDQNRTFGGTWVRP